METDGCHKITISIYLRATTRSHALWTCHTYVPHCSVSHSKYNIHLYIAEFFIWSSSQSSLCDGKSRKITPKQNGMHLLWHAFTMVWTLLSVYIILYLYPSLIAIFCHASGSLCILNLTTVTVLLLGYCTS